MKNFINNSWLKIVAIAMLLGAIASYFSAMFTFPYAFYQFMNWAVAGAALIIVWQSYKMQKSLSMWLFALVAVVFNPIAPIYLGAFAWQIADIVVVVLFLISFFCNERK